MASRFSAELPILSNLVVQDQYSVPADGHYPCFTLHRQATAVNSMELLPTAN